MSEIEGPNVTTLEPLSEDQSTDLSDYSKTPISESSDPEPDKIKADTTPTIPEDIQELLDQHGGKDGLASKLDRFSQYEQAIADEKQRQAQAEWEKYKANYDKSVASQIDAEYQKRLKAELAKHRPATEEEAWEMAKRIEREVEYNQFMNSANELFEQKLYHYQQNQRQTSASKQAFYKENPEMEEYRDLIDDLVDNKGFNAKGVLDSINTVIEYQRQKGITSKEKRSSTPEEYDPYQTLRQMGTTARHRNLSVVKDSKAAKADQKVIDEISDRLASY